MAKQVTFTVSKPGSGKKTECVFMEPENLSDPRWTELVSDVEKDVNELAVQSIVIKIQSGARRELEEKGEAAAQEYVANYKYGARQGGGFRRPTISTSVVKELRFTAAQIEALKAAGVKIPTEEEEAAAAAPAEAVTA